MASKKKNLVVGTDGASVTDGVNISGCRIEVGQAEAVLPASIGDISSCRLSFEDEGYDFDGSGTKESGRVLVKTPHRTWWVRAHHDESLNYPVATIDASDDRDDVYLLDGPIYDLVKGRSGVKTKWLVPTMTSMGILFLWSVRLPSPRIKNDTWARSCLKCLERARTGWRRIDSNPATGSYESYVSEIAIKDPRWPEDLSVESLVASAFENRVIKTMDHPVLKSISKVE
jgi:hypothetical protein